MNKPKKGILPRAMHKPKGLRYTSAVLFGRPGVGKTYYLTTFKNALSVDLEGGTRMMECAAVEPRNWAELNGVLDALDRYRRSRLRSLYRKRLPRARDPDRRRGGARSRVGTT